MDVLIYVMFFLLGVFITMYDNRKINDKTGVSENLLIFSILKEESGKQFNEFLVEEFLSIQYEWKPISY